MILLKFNKLGVLHSDFILKFVNLYLILKDGVLLSLVTHLLIDSWLVFDYLSAGRKSQG
jgi:hypothetical protein